MFQLPVYRAERDSGLEQAIRSTSAIAIAALAKIAAPFEVPEKDLSLLKSRASSGDFDLHYLKTVLVSTAWNKNDDVFSREDTWAARATPEHKPFNYEHDCTDIIGHITGNTVIDADGKVVDDDTVIDDLPAKFHIVTDSVLYKYWDVPERQERMDKVLAEIAEGKWFVSMEVLFKGFDYALIDQAGVAKVVARNEETAFLTKHLRSYGGTGKYEQFKVGRLLRNMVFSGKGLVRKPANPESIIFAQAHDFSPSKANFNSFLSNEKSLGYSQGNGLAKNKESEVTMAVEVKDLEKELGDLKAAYATLKDSQTNSEIKKLTDAKTGAEAAFAELSQKLVAATKANETLTSESKASVDALQAKLATAEQALKVAGDELAVIKATQKRAERLALVVAALKVASTDVDGVKSAEAMTDSLLGLSDEQFSVQIQAVAKFTPAQLPPKGTPAPLPPQATSLPAPMAGKAAELKTVLETATPVVTPALAVASESDGAANLRLSIAKAFNYTDPHRKEVGEFHGS